MLLVPLSMSFIVQEAEAVGAYESGQEIDWDRVEQEDCLYNCSNFSLRVTICSAFNMLCDEEPEHYVERYITEPEYKAWFNRNFGFWGECVPELYNLGGGNCPDYTIYEAVGITVAEYKEIVAETGYTSSNCYLYSERSTCVLVQVQSASEQETITVQKQTAQESGGNEIVYVLVAAVAVGGGIGAIFFIKKGSKPSTAVQQESPSRRQKTVLFCGKCGSSLIPGARFCGKCGNPQS